MPKRGRYIVIEGNDGTGKSTQVELLRKRLAVEGIESVEFHEPAGTPIADRIRDVIKDGRLMRDPETNLLLFTAARHEIWRNAESKLSAGIWVISARNYYSTLVYQGHAEGLDLKVIDQTTRLFTSEAYIHPDLSVILDLSLDERAKRIQLRDNKHLSDTFERRNEHFQEKVNYGYRAIAKQFSFPVIDASASKQDISKIIWSHIEPMI